jgi:hypothetical protein
LTRRQAQAQDLPVSTLRIKNLNSPDSVLRDARMHADAVEIGDITV